MYVAIGCGAAGVLFALGDHRSNSPSSVVQAPRDESVLSTHFSGSISTDSLAVAAPRHEPVATPDLSPEDLYELVAPSVVTIIVEDEDGDSIGSGSGFLIDEATLSDRYDSLDYNRQFAKSRTDKGTPTQFGYVLTNYHVIRPAVSADVVLFNGDEGLVWQVLAEDENADLALLLVCFSSSQSLKGIPFALHNPRVLTTVYAIGSPKGLSGSASEGKVSGLRELSTGEQWLQTTAPISPGSSGGPLMLSDGKLAGVTTMFLKDAQNLNFAIPVSAVRKFFAATEIRPREVAEGASIHWHEATAFSEMAAMVELSESVDGFPHQYTASEKNAIALLKQAREVVFRKESDSREAMEQYRQSIALAQEANESLPKEFNYLGHYLVGMSSVFAASESSRSSAERGILTKEESSALYRASAYSDFALRRLKLATTMKPDSPLAYQQLYFHYSHCGDWIDALAAADTLVSLMPRCANALEYRGSCYFGLNRPKSGIDDYRAAIDLSPRNGWLRIQLAERLSEFGEYREAINEYETAFEILEKDPGIVPLALTRYRFGLVYMNAGNFEKAISEFTKARAMGFSPYFCEREIAKCREKQR